MPAVAVPAVAVVPAPPVSARPSALGASAFEGFCRETTPWLVARLRGRTGSREEAQDLCQEALARAWRQWDEVQAAASPGAWVCTVADRLVIDGWRRRAYVASRQRLAPPAGPAPDRDDVLALRQALAGLGPDVREAVVLHYYEDWSIARIASTAGVTTSSVKSRLHRGRAVLAAALADDGDAQSPGRPAVPRLAGPVVAPADQPPVGRPAAAPAQRPARSGPAVPAPVPAAVGEPRPGVRPAVPAPVPAAVGEPRPAVRPLDGPPRLVIPGQRRAPSTATQPA